LGASLEPLGIPIVYVEMESAEQYFDDIRTIGELFGDTERADEIIAYYQEHLDRIDAALADPAESENPSVLLLQYSAEGDTVAVEVPSADWLQTRQVELAGGNPVWKDAAPAGGWTTVNFEQIAQWNPDKIFVVTYQSDASEVVGKLAESPEWQALDAVKNGEIYGFPEDIFGWDSPDPRWILGVTWLGTKIHLEAMRDVDMMQEIRTFFETIYGMDEATIDTYIIPALTMDVQ
jgi:iron complex transport system substrate-binding protein